MADFEEALNSLLADPDAMGQIMSLAGKLGMGTESPPSPGEAAPCGSRIPRGRRSAAQIISGRLIAAPTSPRKLFRHRITPAEAALTPPVG